MLNGQEERVWLECGLMARCEEVADVVGVMRVRALKVPGFNQPQTLDSSPRVSHEPTTLDRLPPALLRKAKGLGQRSRGDASLRSSMTDWCVRRLETALTMSGGSRRSVVDSLESW